VYDVIVVGAGPAGSMASYMIASTGYSVLMIEKKKEIGFPIQCGEGITQFCLQYNKLPEGNWIKWKVKGVKSMLPSGYYFYTEEPGYSIDRAGFDKWLAECAIERGAELVNAKAKAIEGKAGKWKIFTNEGEYKGRIVIGADGPSSNIARWRGLLMERHYLLAYQYKFDAKYMKQMDDKWFSIYWHEKFRGGYGWVFPRGEEYNVGVGGVNASVSQLKSFCKSIGIDIDKKKEMNKGVIPFAYKFVSRAQEGIMIVGDAACMTNPTSGGGIQAALASGRISAKKAIKSLEEENFSITLEYDREIRKTPYLHPAHLKCARYLQKWKNEDWFFLGSILHGKKFTDLTLWRSFLAGLKHPSYLLRAREMLTIRKAMKINQKYGW